MSSTDSSRYFVWANILVSVLIYLICLFSAGPTSPKVILLLTPLSMGGPIKFPATNNRSPSALLAMFHISSANDQSNDKLLPS